MWWKPEKEKNSTVVKLNSKVSYFVCFFSLSLFQDEYNLNPALEWEDEFQGKDLSEHVTNTHAHNHGYTQTNTSTGIEPKRKKSCWAFRAWFRLVWVFFSGRHECVSNECVFSLSLDFLYIFFHLFSVALYFSYLLSWTFLVYCSLYLD